MVGPVVGGEAVLGEDRGGAGAAAMGVVVERRTGEPLLGEPGGVRTGEATEEEVGVRTGEEAT